VHNSLQFTSTATFENVLRLVVWKRDGGVGLWVSVQDKCGNAVDLRIASKIETRRVEKRSDNFHQKLLYLVV
jgi:hypothetical protein